MPYFEAEIEEQYLSLTRLISEVTSTDTKLGKIRLFAQSGSELTDDSDVSFHFSSKIPKNALFFTSKNQNFESKWLPEMYDKLQKLGEGGFGVVHLARNKHTNEYIAMKVFRNSISV